MEQLFRYLQPNRKDFEIDPFGYSSLARHKWGLIKELNGFSSDISKPATADELKDPMIWLTHAEALTQSAILIVKNEPSFDAMPAQFRTLCDSQFCAIGLMLLGYSLEICLKAMLIMKNGIDKYIEIEEKNKHHNLAKLADFVPNLTKKDRVILNLLTHFIYWAGRYPDPGIGKEYKAEEIFTLSEKHKITAKELFSLASKVMGHAKVVADSQ